MIQLFALHTPYGLMTAAAAIDAGLVAPAAERVLVPINSAAVPETNIGLDESPHLRSLVARFDRIEPLNRLLDPAHPTAWAPADTELPTWERLIRQAWRLGDDELELFVQTPQVAPARTLMALFPAARISIVGDGLMTYGPIRTRAPRQVAERVERVIYPDVVPHLSPLLFARAGAQPVPLPVAAFAQAIAEVDAHTADGALDRLAADTAPTAMMLGQYLAALGLVTHDDEAAMQADMVDRACAWGAQRIVFKPHPTAPAALTDGVRERARARGVAFAVYDADAPAEVLVRRLHAVGVVAGFSTALPTVHTVLGTPIAAVGTAEVLRALTPYENGNRIPATIVDALTRSAPPYTDPQRLQLLVDAVGYAMQPRTAAHLRGRAEQLLRTLDPAERERYFTARRLAELDLPGAPTGPIARLLYSRAGASRRDEVRLAVRGASRRAERAWKAVRGR